MMRMEAAWFWIALPPLLLWVWWLGRRSYAQMRPAARWISMALRIVILTCLIGALARPILMRESARQHVIFLLDVSRSVGVDNLEAALADVDALARQAVDQGHRASVIAFGRAARVLMMQRDSWEGWPQEMRDMVLQHSTLPRLYTERTQLLSDGAAPEQRRQLEERIANLERFRDEVVGDATDLQGALRLAFNCGAVDEARTLYVFTDANFNRGDWRQALIESNPLSLGRQPSFDEKARPRERAGVRVQDSDEDTANVIRLIALDRPIPPEVAAGDLILPSKVRVNQGFSADLHVASSVETGAKIVIYKDGYASAEMNAMLKPGDNTIRIPGLYFREKGFHSVDVAVRTDEAADTQVENNTVKSLVIVPGEARVLYVDADESQQSYLKSALELEGMQVETRPASGVPQTLADLLNFDVLILSNVPADQIAMRQMQMIRAYVQDFGGGFIMLGGDNSFGLGGYYNTPIEEILPVTMPIQKDMLRPSLAIMLVIDKSGSMSGVKIQLAKRAAIATAEVINPRDQIGVVGFDGESRVILELTSAGDRATVASNIGSLEAGGGTFLYPGLEDARDRLTQSNARRKHIIILSDGQTQGFGYGEMAQVLAADGITVSTVGIGEGADMRLMEEIAGAGGGRAYFTNDFQSIPQIFTREALRASKSMLVERLVQPILAEDDEALEELDAEELPLLNGYVATTPRETAKTIIVSDAGDPLLAKWRCGLGRSAAFTSDTKPRWAEEWIRWPDFAKFWTQLVRSVAGQELADDISIDVRHEPQDDGVRLLVDVRDAAGDFISDRPLELAMYDPQKGSQQLAVQREGPGLFSAVVPEIAFGKSQQFAWSLPRTDGENLTVPFGYVYSFSPEFRTLGPSEEILREIADRHLASVSRLGETDLALAHRSSMQQVRLWPALLIIALLLAPIDILCRRFG